MDVSNPLSPKKFPTVLQGNGTGTWSEPDVAAITRNPAGTSWILAVGDIESARLQTYVVPASSWNPDDPGKTWLDGADSTTNDPFVSTTYSGQGNRYMCSDDYNGYKSGYCKYVYSQKEAKLYWLCMGGKDVSGGTADNRLWGRVVSTSTGLPLDGDSNALDHAEASDPDAWRGFVGEDEGYCSFRAGTSIFIDDAGELRVVCSEKKFSESLGNLQIDELWRP